MTAQATKVYVSMEGQGRRLIVDGDLGLLRELMGSLGPSPRRSTKGERPSTKAETEPLHCENAQGQ